MSDEVVGLVAWCDYVPDDQWAASPGTVSIAVHEVAVLADGRRIKVRADRGFGISGPLRPTASDPLAGMTAKDIEGHARTTVLPDGVDSEDAGADAWLRELLGRQGVVVTTTSLTSVPYTVEFSERLRRLLAQHSDPD